MAREIDLSRFAWFALLDTEPTPIQPLDNLNRRLADGAGTCASSSSATT